MHKRILLLCRLRIGDCIFTTPAVRAIRQAFPHARVSIVVPEANVELFAHSPQVDAIIPRPVRSWWGKVRFIRDVRREQFDLIVSFQEKSIFYALTARFGGTRESYSLRHWRTRHCYRKTVPWPGNGIHRVERYLTLARATGAATDASPHTELHLGRESRVRAAELLAEAGVGEQECIVALNPGSTERSRRWDPACFAAVGDRLVHEVGARIVILGGKRDRETGAEIAAAMTAPAIDLTGRTRLLETGAVLERCTLLVSGDTGPLHLAAALGTPAVALFGPSDPHLAAPRYGARGGEARIIRGSGSCARCSSPCLHTISPETCATAALDLLGQPSERQVREMTEVGGVSGG